MQTSQPSINNITTLSSIKDYTDRHKHSYGNKNGPSYANIFMKYIEIQLIDTPPRKPKMWPRFIDDIFMIWGHSRYELDNFIHLANNLH